MLAIRMQRTGRSGHAQFRIVVQDSRQTPTSGRVVTLLGNYNPHTKDIKLDLNKTAQYLANGAQPSDRIVLLLAKTDIKLPAWVHPKSKASKAIKNTAKLRKNRPPVDEQPAPDEAVAIETTVASEDSIPAEVA